MLRSMIHTVAPYLATGLELGCCGLLHNLDGRLGLPGSRLAANNSGGQPQVGSHAVAVVAVVGAAGCDDHGKIESLNWSTARSAAFLPE